MKIPSPPSTDPVSGAPLTDAQLHALVDGALPAAEQDALRLRLQSDAAAAASVDAWSAQREALRALHAPLLAEPVPDSLLAAAARVHDARQSALRWQRFGGMAAGLACAFVVGWAARGLEPQTPPPLQAQRVASSFVHQAAMAHLVYAPEVRHPVEVAAAEQEHLVQWLSKRLGRPLRLPDLSAQGFALVGGRLLPGEQGARAQFMFQDTNGQRVTLYLGAVAAGAAATTASQPLAERLGETAFQLSMEPVPSFYWVDQGFGYALAGPLPRERLLALARAVYQQL